MIDNYSTVKAYVLELGGFEDSTKLDLQIQMIINEVLAYCYRPDVPTPMELPLADVIVNELNKINTGYNFGGDVTGYREGDMSINFGSSVSATGQSVKYGGKLEGFKRIIGAISEDIAIV